MSPLPDLEQILATTVFAGGVNQPFGQLTPDAVRARADELRAATGWGPTARVAPVARAWRELSIEMERAGASSVSELDPALVVKLAPQLWVALPVSARGQPPASSPNTGGTVRPGRNG